jgi:hypothetical protein
MKYILIFQEVAQFWSWHGKVFHCHEVVDFDNIPNEGGAVLVINSF